MGPNLDLLTILYLLCASYPKRCGLDRNINHLRLVNLVVRVDLLVDV